MTLENLPLCVAFTVLGVLSFFIGFHGGLPYWVGAYVICLVAVLAYALLKRDYDRRAPVPGLLAVFSGFGILATVVLFLRLWQWKPEELLIVNDPRWVKLVQEQYWLAAAIALALMWVVPVVFQRILFSFFRGGEKRRF